MTYDSPAEWRPRAAIYREVTAQALPSTFAMMILLIAGFVVQYYLKGFGPAALAAYGVGLRIEQLILLPGFGLTGALLPIAAQNFGAKDFDRVREAVFFCFKAGVAIMLCGSLVLWFAARPLVGVFTSDPDVVQIGGDYLHVDGFILPVYIVLFAINSFLQALKRPMATVWIGLYRQGIAVAIFCYLFVRVLDLGTWGVWFGIAVAVTTGLILSLFIAERTARVLIGGLFTAAAPVPAAGTEATDQSRG
jgi:Na+-driven multidrug efflux pump